MKTCVITPSRFVTGCKAPGKGFPRRLVAYKGGLRSTGVVVKCTLAPLVREPSVTEGSLPVLSFVDRLDGGSSQVRRKRGARGFLGLM